MQTAELKVVDSRDKLHSRSKSETSPEPLELFYIVNFFFYTSV